MPTVRYEVRENGILVPINSFQIRNGAEVAVTHYTPYLGGGGTDPNEPDPATWELTYSTEFSSLAGWTVNNNQTQSNDNSINLAKNVTPGALGGGKGLRIEGIRESGYSRPFTSGEIEGHGAQVVPNYFRCEVIASHMDEQGLWPSNLWFRPQSGGDGSNGEIDVHEFFGGNFTGDQKRYAITMHNEYGATQDSIKNFYRLIYLDNQEVTAIRKFVLEKTPGLIEVWIDKPEQVRRFGPNASNGGPNSPLGPAALTKPWWDRIMEAANRTWYPRITLQIGSGSSTAAVPNPVPTWTYSTMDVYSVRLWRWIG